MIFQLSHAIFSLRDTERGAGLTENKRQGVKTRRPAYSLEQFLNDCKNHRERIQIDSSAINDAVNIFHINGDPEQSIKDEILDQIVLYDIEQFEYINTREFEKGINGAHPLVDAYTFIYNKFIRMYIAFCIVQTRNGWFIKSLHSDHSHQGFGDSMSIGEIIKQLGRKR